MWVALAEDSCEAEIVVISTKGFVAREVGVSVTLVVLIAALRCVFCDALKGTLSMLFGVSAIGWRGVCVLWPGRLIAVVIRPAGSAFLLSLKGPNTPIKIDMPATKVKNFINIGLCDCLE